MQWGKLAIINLYGCCPKYLRDKKKIKKFIRELCKNINMNKVGKTIIKRFGKGSLKGYSAMQFIKTSSITAHFDEENNRAFIDIFSCKKFNEKRAEQFSKDFFKAKKSKIKILYRE